jgi:hypothetical protein
VLALTAAAAIVTGNAIARARRADARPRGGWLWQITAPGLDTSRVVDQCWAVLWDLIRGAARIKQPTRQELGRRYVELLSENLGQPGFRELLIAAHDVDVRADVIFALVSESRRPGLIRRGTTKESEARRAGVVDLAGIGRDHLADAVAAALAVPLATETHTITFAPESYWRGESHRLCDRSGMVGRLVDELQALGVEQIILVTAAPEPAEPHQLHRPPGDVRARIGEYLQSAEAAAVADLLAGRRRSPVKVFPIRPFHNPIGPFDFGGGFDDRSNRRQPLAELLNGGYEDAFRQFIEPVVGASGERVGV